MSDDKDADPSDWLAKQFHDSGEVEPAPVEAPVPEALEAPVPEALEGPVSDSVPEALEGPIPAKPFDWGFGTSEPLREPQGPVVEPPVAEALEAPAAQPPVAEALEAPAPEDIPTQAFTMPDPAATVAIPAVDLPDAVAQPATERIVAPSDTPIDSLFNAGSFQDYDESLLAGVPDVALPRRGGPRPPRGAGTPLLRNQRILIIVAAALVAALILVVLFFLGTRLSSAIGAAPTPTPTPTVTKTPTPTPTPVATGAASVGVHRWSDLRGGECVGPFTTVWAETFTVVDCATPHPAQMVFRGTFPAAAAAAAATTATPAPSASPDAYPGVAALQAQINLLCTSPGVIDLNAAGAYTDIQFQGAFAGDAKEWKAGQHDYFCFVTRSSGQPLTTSVAGTPAK